MQEPRKSILRSGVALLLLLIFSLSITPKIFLHDITANHKDQINFAIEDGHDQHVDQKGFSCDTLSIVATSPFEEASEKVELRSDIFFAEFQAEFTSQLYTYTLALPALRGPPVKNSSII